MKTQMYGRILRTACWLALVGIALMVWSLLVPSPMPVLVAMSVGQALGTLSLVAFLCVVVVDLRRAHLERPPGPSDPPAPRG
jgi:hypothetical protein